MTHKLTRIQLGWIAGFLEGEGCFLTSPTGSPGIKVLSTDRDVLVKYGGWVDRPVRGPYGDNRGGKDRWEVNLYGQPAADLMALLLPYMGERRSAKIRVVLDAASIRQLKQGIREMQATCHPKQKRYYKDGHCRNCYEKWRRARVAKRMETVAALKEQEDNGLPPHTKSLQT